MSYWYCSALCGYPLPASANNWIHGLQLADIPPPKSATLGLHPVASKLLLISRPAKGRRLSWPKNTRMRDIPWIGYKTKSFCSFSFFKVWKIWNIRFVRNLQHNWTPAVSFIMMTSSSWRHVHSEHSLLVWYFTQPEFFHNCRVPNNSVSCELSSNITSAPSSGSISRLCRSYPDDLISDTTWVRFIEKKVYLCSNPFLLILDTFAKNRVRLACLQMKK